MPLTIECLQTILDHVGILEKEDDHGESELERQFQILKEKSTLYRQEKTFATTEGEKEYNRKKNRYKDILPFDETRVVLKMIPYVQGSDYINANYIKGASGKSCYIASQGPLPTTVNDFWRMAWENQVQVIIMVCSLMEDGKSKCEQYWPKAPEKEAKFGDITVKLVNAEEGKNGIVTRVLNVLHGEESRQIQQYHYDAWPDHGITTSITPIIELITMARHMQPQELPPILVHCSAGCGRTGTICAIDYIWNLLKTGKITTDFTLFEVIANMRQQRPSIVQAKDQYELVHRVVVELLHRQLDLIQQNDYENVNHEGKPVNQDQDDSEYMNLEDFCEDSLDPASRCLDTSMNYKQQGHSNSQHASASVLRPKKNPPFAPRTSPRPNITAHPKPKLSSSSSNDSSGDNEPAQLYATVHKRMQRSPQKDYSKEKISEEHFFTNDNEPSPQRSNDSADAIPKFMPREKPQDLAVKSGPKLNPEYSDPFDTPHAGTGEYSVPYEDKTGSTVKTPVVAPPRKKKGIQGKADDYEEVGEAQTSGKRVDNVYEYFKSSPTNRSQPPSQQTKAGEPHGLSEHVGVPTPVKPSEPHPDMVTQGGTLDRFLKKVIKEGRFQITDYPNRMGKPKGPRKNHLDPNWP